MKKSSASVVTHLFGHKLRPQMRESFTEWVTQSSFAHGADEAEAAADFCDAVLGLIGTRRPHFNPIAWVPDDAHALFDVQDEMFGAPEFDDDDGAGAELAADATTMAAFMLLVYLDESGQWAGTESDLEHCLRDLAPPDGPSSPEPVTRSAVTPAAVDAEVEQAALAGLPIIGRLTRFVDWLGSGKAVTGTGVLRPAHATAMAEFVGIDLPPGKLRTMLDVGELRRLWAVALHVGLVAVNSTKAYPGPESLRWRSAPLDLLRRAVAGHVAAEVDNDDVKYGLYNQVNILAVQFMLAGMTDKPLAALDGHPPAAPAETEPLSALLQVTLRHLADEGVIVIAESVTVPQPLRSAVWAGLPDHQIGDEDYLFADDDYDDVPSAGKVTDQEITLTIRLQGCEPAVWRQVVVDSGSSLAELHTVIQSVFDWDDVHLHEFIDGEPYSGAPVYVPAQSIAGRDLAGRAHPEESTSVGQVLDTSGRTVTYVYDFGDDWIHTITVDSIGPAQQVPRCVAGQGMAPREDCGGPHGWAMLVDAINDPGNPAHEDMRAWTGLGEGLTIDPAAFDVVQADAGLRRMRASIARR